ncbi:unnamed protein product [Vicia faba]|uniref:Uncharacterized protein n=1 Tax=Vicia faba TaxID=3906 RepID=A0AAV1AFK5_VICFA|nr:unnamed protein product [Vicia faba]
MTLFFLNECFFLSLNFFQIFSLSQSKHTNKINLNSNKHKIISSKKKFLLCFEVPFNGIQCSSQDRAVGTCFCSGLVSVSHLIWRWLLSALCFRRADVAVVGFRSSPVTGFVGKRKRRR